MRTSTATSPGDGTPWGRVFPLALLAIVSVGLLSPVSLGAEVLAGQNGVVVERETTAGPWTLSNGSVTLTVGFDSRQELQVQSLAPASHVGPVVEPTHEPALVLNGRHIRLTDAPRLGIRFLSASVTAEGQGLRLELSFASANPAAQIRRSFACYPRVPVIEVWTTVTVSGAGAPVTVGSPETWRLAPIGQEVTWVRGLNAPEESGGSFSLERQMLGPGDSLHLEATGRSTESALPWFTASHDGTTVFGGLEWSGRWALTLTGTGSGTDASVGLPGAETRVTATRSFTFPRGFFGVVAGDAAAVGAAMRQFVTDVVRQGRRFDPLVTYNTWFAHGTWIDAGLIAREIETAAELGVELFQLDAGWYAGSTTEDPYDFSNGLGSWYPDQERFPDGLQPLIELAHERGLRFGLWVEPERVDLSTVGKPGMVSEAWLATSGGHYDPAVPQADARTAQVCLAHPSARQWVFEQLSRLIEEYGLDYIKWDNNAWVTCDRTGHDHGVADGDVAHVEGLYEVLGALRARYPELLIENCAGGGNRIDLGLARLTDVGWMDDRSASSTHVRHNLQGLSSVLPPAYLLSYVMSGEDGAIQSEDDLAWLARSRMMGVMGLTYRADELDAGDRDAIAAEIQGYKRLREIVRDASAALLTEQVSEVSDAAWDVTEAITQDGTGVIFAFQDEDADEITVHPVLLLPDLEYEVAAIDGRILDQGTGVDLMASGIEFRPDDSRAQVVLLIPKQP